VKNVLRPLALLNLLAAIAFVFPVVLFLVSENTARGSLVFQLPAPPVAAQGTEQIRGIKDIEVLRRRAFMLEQMLDLELRSRTSEISIFRQAGGGMGVLLVIAAAGFLVNAGFLIWALRKQLATP